VLIIIIIMKITTMMNVTRKTWGRSRRRRWW